MPRSISAVCLHPFRADYSNNNNGTSSHEVSIQRKSEKFCWTGCLSVWDKEFFPSRYNKISCTMKTFLTLCITVIAISAFAQQRPAAPPPPPPPPPRQVIPRVNQMPLLLRNQVRQFLHQVGQFLLLVRLARRSHQPREFLPSQAGLQCPERL